MYKNTRIVYIDNSSFKTLIQFPDLFEFIALVVENIWHVGIRRFEVAIRNRN
jgi:hypothetical protein